MTVEASAVHAQVAERRTLGHDQGRRDQGHAAARPRLPRAAAGHARRRRHQRAQRAGLECVPRDADQRAQRSVDGHVVRRRFQQGHGIRRGQLRDAVARLDRRSKDSDVELPGRVRPCGRRQHHRRHQERQLQVQRIGGVLQASRRRSPRTPGTVGAPATRPAGPRRCARSRATATTTRRSRWAARS